MKEKCYIGTVSDPVIGVQGQTTHRGSTHVMVMPLRAGRTQPGGAQPLSPRLYILHAYTRLKMTSSKVSIMIRNMFESSIFLKKRVQVTRVVSISPILPAELFLEMEAILGTEDKGEPLCVAE